MIAKRISVVLSVAVSLIAIPSWAEVSLMSYRECWDSCNILDEACHDTCAAKVGTCIECCHLKLPSATQQYCGANCAHNVESFSCKKGK